MNSPVSWADALRFWLKLGFISFGGPAGQIAIMHRELVEQKRWLSERRFLHALNYCMVLPGPEAQQLATYIGWLMHGTWGGIVAGMLFVLPSLAILIALSYAYVSFGNVPAVAGALEGIKPAVTAIVLFAAWRIGTRALTSPALVGIAVLSFAAIFVGNAPFPAIILAAAALGWLGGRLLPSQFSESSGHTAATASGAYLIDDDTPRSAHTRFRWERLLAYLFIGLAIWFGTMALLAAHSGTHGTLVQMGWFFTKAALLTFGGAYAVLPYVYQGAVESFQWLTPQQMIDGLALGETTPGPLIMVVAFVGYLGGWSKAVLGPDSLFAGAALAACTATFFTFLPSFLFILIGGPVVESTHGQMRITAPLSAITAAVVGVIVNLGLFFAWKVWWPQGSAANPFGGSLNWFSITLTLVASVALLRYKAGVIPIIAACAATGVFRSIIA